MAGTGLQPGFKWASSLTDQYNSNVASSLRSESDAEEPNASTHNAQNISAPATEPVVQFVLCTTQDHTSTDLLIHIFQMLATDELETVRRVCRTWKALAESNTIWKPICARYWPSTKDEPIKTFIENSGGFRAYYQTSRPRRRSNYNDLIFTLDIYATSYEFVANTQAVSGISFAGSEIVWDDERAIVKLSKPWNIVQHPYRFMTLVDFLSENGPRVADEADRKLCMPELTIKCAIINCRAQRRIHFATLEEGSDIRTRAWYNRNNDANNIPIPINMHNNNGIEEEDDGDDSGLDEVSSAAGTNMKKTLPFSGAVLLPIELNRAPEHIFDITLIGNCEILPDKSVKRRVTEVHLGPMFNLSNRVASLASCSNDFIDIIDLKLGLFAQNQMTEFGKRIF